MNKDYLENLKAELKQRGITQKDLAFMLGKSPSWIGDILRGNYPYRGAWGCPLYLSRWADRHDDDNEWIDCSGHKIPKF